MIELRDKESGASLGSITEAQLEFLQGHLEEESETDSDYYINRDTLDVLEEEGADAALMSLLRRALGPREEMEIQWRRSS
ncbi:MAG TPA: galactosyldiacylglycerol synthase [Candidatus Polarisedimenticolia bacterium]|nr:galactosyldiacylglycerol synthase [Candidatus Polarisedimenticolia bacterium]